MSRKNTTSRSRLQILKTDHRKLNNDLIGCSSIVKTHLEQILCLILADKSKTAILPNEVHELYHPKSHKGLKSCD